MQPNAEPLIAAIADFLGDRDLLTLEDIRDALAVEFERAGPDALVTLNSRLATAGSDWDYYPADPLAKRVHHLLADRLLEPGSRLEGVQHLPGLNGRPVVIFANHLSYADANLLEVLLHRAGGSALADRLTTIAGPKVYSSRKRRFSSLCFGTIKTPQSSALSSEEATMDSRSVARAARRSIQIAHDRVARGDALLVFGEGTRSRTRGMQPMLGGVARYLEGPEAIVLPIGITGTEALFPIGEETLHPVQVVIRVGRPIDAAVLRARSLGDRRRLMDAVGLAIARLLPPEYRGVYGVASDALASARDLLDGEPDAARSS